MSIAPKLNGVGRIVVDMIAMSSMCMAKTLKQIDDVCGFCLKSL